jgi:excinuclease ABC subunit C
LLKNAATLPDLLIIDGGKGQLHEAEQVLYTLQITGVVLLAVAKGPSRKPGCEELHLSGHSVPFSLAPDSPGLHLIQQIRDEAHRFAITGHRNQRDKARTVSVLEQIPGVGPTRRRALLHYFGGLQEMMEAHLEDLTKVPGINKPLAEKILLYLHQGSR